MQSTAGHGAPIISFAGDRVAWYYVRGAGVFCCLCGRRAIGCRRDRLVKRDGWVFIFSVLQFFLFQRRHCNDLTTLGGEDSNNNTDGASLFCRSFSTYLSDWCR